MHTGASATIYSIVPCTTNFLLTLVLILIVRRCAHVRRTLSIVTARSTSVTLQACCSVSAGVQRGSCSQSILSGNEESDAGAQPVRTPTAVSLDLRLQSAGFQQKEDIKSGCFAPTKITSCADGLSVVQTTRPVASDHLLPSIAEHELNAIPGAVRGADTKENLTFEPLSLELPPKRPSNSMSAIGERNATPTIRELSNALLQVCVSLFQVLLSLPLSVSFLAYALKYMRSSGLVEFNHSISEVANVSSFLVKFAGIAHFANFFIYLIQVDRVRKYSNFICFGFTTCTLDLLHVHGRLVKSRNRQQYEYKN